MSLYCGGAKPSHSHLAVEGGPSCAALFEQPEQDDDCSSVISLPNVGAKRVTFNKKVRMVKMAFPEGTDEDKLKRIVRPDNSGKTAEKMRASNHKCNVGNRPASLACALRNAKEMAEHLWRWFQNSCLAVANAPRGNSVEKK